jgi:hypothetical protein
LTSRFDGFLCWFDDKAMDTIANDLLAFVRAGVEGERSEWIKARFGLQYPHDQPDEDIARDLLDLAIDHCSVGIFRCPICDRIVAYEGGEWRGYRPDPPGDQDR